jgi:serine/threonine protein kinase/formylglycine-generating enzyme required for sulfatase activity
MTVGTFRLQKLLGEGGMGAVYLAEDITLSRRVALKFMRRALLAQQASPAARSKIEARFIREARSAAAIAHPAIAQIYTANFDSNDWYIAMELVDGEALDSLLKSKGNFPPSQVAQILAEACEGLSLAWDSANIIHRDIKPQNIMLTQKGGHVKIVDLGLAKPVAESDEVDDNHLEVTGAGVPVGTPYYMAPEQATGGKVDFRADMFALGATVYELLTGKRAFQARSPALIYAMQTGKEYRRLSEACPECPPQLAAIIERLLEPEASARYASYSELLADLNRFRGGNQVAIQDAATVVFAGHAHLGLSQTDALTSVDIFLPVDHKILDRYRVLQVIGRGNTGIVYKCLDTKLEKECTVKAIMANREYPAETFARIKRNYLELARRRHPALVAIIDVAEGRGGAELYVVMELLQGRNLLSWIQEKQRTGGGDLSPAVIAPVFHRIADAVDALNASFSAIHGDLKPVSIFLTEQDTQVRILDYGVTWMDPSEDKIRGSAEPWRFPTANPDYMAPELWRHDPPTTGADLYSLAVITYEALGRKLPFWLREFEPDGSHRDDSASVMLRGMFGAVQEKSPAPLGHLSPKENKALLQGLAKTAEGRYPNCRAFALALFGQSGAGELPPAYPSSGGYSQPRPKSSGKTLLIAAAILAAGGTATALLLNQAESKKEASRLHLECQDLNAILKTAALPVPEDLSALVASAETAWKDGDWSLAAERYRDAKSRLEQVAEQLLKDLRTRISEQDQAVLVVSSQLNERRELLALRNNKTFVPVEPIKAPADSSPASLARFLEQRAKPLAEWRKELHEGISTEVAVAIAEISGRRESLNALIRRFEGETLDPELRSRLEAQMAEASGSLNERRYASAWRALRKAEASAEALRAKLNSAYDPLLAKTREKLAPLRQEVAAGIWMDEAMRSRLPSPFQPGADAKESLQRAQTELSALSELKAAQERLLPMVQREIETCVSETEAARKALAGTEKLLPGLEAFDLESIRLNSLPSGDLASLRNGWKAQQGKIRNLSAALDKILAAEVDALMVGASEAVQKILPSRDISPDLAMSIDELQILSSSARSARSENQLRKACDEFRKVIADAAALQARADALSKAVPGKDYAVPRLGAKLVWIPEMKLWAARTELSNGEFRRFRAGHRSTILAAGSLDGDRQPVIQVTARDAEAFCSWLTRVAQQNGEIPKTWRYRLPSAEEWQQLASCGKETTYPWGDAFSPPKDTNFGSEATLDPGETLDLEGYKDRFPLTAPVDAAGIANPWGLLGMPGNVWEWTSSSEAGKNQVLGGSWMSNNRGETLLKPSGNLAPAEAKNDNIGFRILLAPVP